MNTLFNFVKSIWIRGDSLHPVMRVTDEMMTIQQAIIKHPDHWKVETTGSHAVHIKNRMFALTVALEVQDNNDWVAQVIYPAGSKEPLAYPVAQRLGKWASSLLGEREKVKLAQDRETAMFRLAELDSLRTSDNSE